MRNRNDLSSTLLLAAVMALLLPPVTLAAELTVDSASDNLTAGDGFCTLREAINNANADADTTSSDCVAGTGADTITVPAGIYTLAIAGAGEDANATGDFDLTDADGLTITGAGARSTLIDGGALDRVFDVRASASGGLGQLTIQNGSVAGPLWGGGIRFEGTTLDITRVAVKNNSNIGASVRGGGIVVTVGSVTITESLISGNIVNGGNANAGGIYCSSGSSATVLIVNSTLAGNEAPDAGGVGVFEGCDLTLRGTTVTGNTATSTATTSGLQYGSGGAGNIVTIESSLLVGNVGGDCYVSGTMATYVSNGYNVFGSRANGGCPLDGSTDMDGVPASTVLDTTLADNGGPTDTHALILGGVAVDAFPVGINGCGTTLTEDQRGVARPQAAGCDTGAFELEPPAPNLTIATEIPAAELETVDVGVDFESDGLSIAATTFSIDYDEACLSFDDTDGDADNIPDDLVFSVPADFSVTAFHDLGDTDGEIDVSITDLAPPIATLSDGGLLTITFTSTCEPAVDATILAPVGFSADPVATFSDDLAVDVDGTTTDGSVEIWPGPRGDCNRNDVITAADLIAEVLEIFDDDGSFWADVPGSTFAGSPVGCDANDDTAVNAGDISCTILLIFGGTCGGSRFASPDALDPRNAPFLGLKDAYRDKDGRLWLPVVFSPGAHAISSVAFSLDLAKGVTFDPFDGDGDGLPDAVRFGKGARPELVEVRYDAGDRGGEIDLVLADYGATFARGLLLEVAVEPASSEARQRPARFAKSPAVSFGNTLGQAVPGHVVEAKPGLTIGRK